MKTEMDQFSKEMGSLILEAFPEWKKYASTTEDNGDMAFYLEITPPSKNTNNPLRIYTLREEITVSFDSYHAHFLDFKNTEKDDGISFINQIISDKYAIVSYWRDEQCCGSTILPEDEFPVDNDEFPYANRIEIRSWVGDLDKDIKCESKD